MARTPAAVHPSPSTKTLRSRTIPPSPLQPNPRQQQTSSIQKVSQFKPEKFPNKQNNAQYSPTNHMPSPLFEPLNWFRWLNWRVSIWLQASFAGGMLTDWESLSVAIVTLLLAVVILYSLFFQFPATVKALHKRATYYLFGSSAGAVAAGVAESFPTNGALTGQGIVDGVFGEIPGLK